MEKENTVANLRREYARKSLNENEVADDPLLQFETWWQEAIASGIEEPNAMTLATASVDGIPSARIVLLKGFDSNGFQFYTNYESYKGRQLAENPKACLVFFWKELERQVRITGLVAKLSDVANDVYFSSRPVGSRIGAVVSPQSRIVESREWLDNKYNELLSANKDKEIPRPSHWGGYVVMPVIIEFWQGRPSRMHDRIQYSLEEGGWKIERLAP
ncbi:MAG TPA: pyridoxamine 5'-phosphate oxidase [Chitinophagaceae bacterium]